VKKPESTRPATIGDVARLAGVAQVTVSRVINNENTVRAATREKVLEAVRKLNYVPNHSARNLAGRRAARIGLLYEKPYGGYLSEFIISALNACSQVGHVLVAHMITDDFRQRDLSGMLSLTEEKWDGIIIPPLMSDTQALVDVLAQRSYPLVMIASSDGVNGDYKGPLVSIDDFQAMFDLVSALIEQGHRNIGFLKGHPDQEVSNLRYEGYKAALKQARLKIPAKGVQQGHFTYESGLFGMAKILAAPVRPSAVVCSNDDMAAGALACSIQHGLKIPSDIAITGFDDTPIASSVWPKLTTVRQPVGQMAEVAVSILSDWINTGKLPEAAEQSHHFNLEYTLISRDSAAI